MFSLDGQRIKLPISFVISFLCLTLTPNSYGTLSDNLTIGNAKALSLAHAVTADPPGLDSIHYNPAGLARIKDRRVHYKLIAGSFNIGLDFGNNIPERQDFLDEFARTNITPDGFFYDEAANSQSKTEGASMVIPGIGMTDLPVLLFPLGGVTYSPPNSKITFANTVYTPLGVGFNRADDDPGRFIGKRLSFMLLSYFTPSVAYQVTDTLSIGATLTFNYAAVGLELPFREPHVGLLFLKDLQDTVCTTDDPIINLCSGTIGLYDQLGLLDFVVEDPFTVGYNLGLLWSPTEWLSFGMVYQSKVNMDMEGDFSWQNGDSWVSFIGDLAQDPLYQGFNQSVIQPLGYSLPEGKNTVEGTANLKMIMPEHYAFGISVRVTPQLKINIDYKFTGWSSWEGIPVKFSEPIDFMRLSEIIQPSLGDRQAITFPLGLQDTWNWAIGLEWQYSNRIAFRFGIEDRPTSTPLEARSPLLPMGEGTVYSAGFGLKLEKTAQLDFGIGVFSSEVHMPGGTSVFGNSLDPYKVIYNPYVGRDITSSLDVVLIELGYSKKF